MASLHSDTSSSSTAPLPSSSSQATSPQTDPRVNVVGIVLGIIGIILVTAIIFVTIRMKRRGSVDDIEGSRIGRKLDRSHPAAKVTPFGSSGGETPRYNHTPGADMRIAVRRPDGAWHFSDPRAPFTPSGVSDLDVLPSPASYTSTLPPSIRSKDQLKSSRDLRDIYDRDYDVDLQPPPPAYGYDYSGHVPLAGKN